MKSAFFTTLALSQAIAVASAAHSDSWSPPQPGDVRAPCPMLNTLANHNYLRHTGKDLTREEVLDTLQSALNFHPDFSTYLFEKALTTNPTPNATTFSLSDLAAHNVLEHDGSLSRADWYFGSNVDFNRTVWHETESYFHGDTINVTMASNARAGRIDASNKTNPTFALSSLGEGFDFGETSAYIIALGDRVSGTVPRNRINYLFENERLPYELGWVRANESITLEAVGSMSQRLLEAQGLEPSNATMILERSTGMHYGRGLHGGKMASS
ncbi:Chloroperoxidase [Xylariaceae sp. FL1019]|nr:Chloroperoxidase [Xylariaceae sp. FL1019]